MVGKSSAIFIRISEVDRCISATVYGFSHGSDVLVIGVLDGSTIGITSKNVALWAQRSLPVGTGGK